MAKLRASYLDPQDVLSGGNMRPKRRMSARIGEAIFYAVIVATILWAGYDLMNYAQGF